MLNLSQEGLQDAWHELSGHIGKTHKNLWQSILVDGYDDTTKTVYVEDYTIGEQNEQRRILYGKQICQKKTLKLTRKVWNMCVTLLLILKHKKNMNIRQTKGCEMSRLIHVGVVIPHLAIDSISPKAVSSFKMNEFFGSLQKMNKVIGMLGLINYW